MSTKEVSRFISDHDSQLVSSDVVTHDGYTHLRTLLGRVWKGESRVFTAPFAKGEDIQDVMDEWNKHLVKIKDQYPSLYDFEVELRSKVGPLSVQKPLMQRIDDVSHYFQDIYLKSVPISDSAIKATCAEFKVIKGITPRSQLKTIEKMKKSSNSGTPHVTKRRNVIQETLPCAIYSVGGRHPSVYGVEHGTDWEYCAIIGWRGQEGGPSDEDVKQRVVFMFPVTANIRELQVYQPAIEASQATLLNPAWVSMDDVDIRITKLFDTKNANDLVICTDFSKFDQHFNHDMQDAAFKIISSILDRSKESKDWLESVFYAKYRIPLIWKADKGMVHIFEGEHGMGSGSGGTNFDETCTHRSLQYECAIENGERLNPNSTCLGDDGVLSFPGITVDKVVSAYEKHGQECNTSKQYADNRNCVYLRRWHSMDYRVNGICVGVYSTFRAIGRLRYLERRMDPEVWSYESVALRQLSIIENCNKHPLFHEFIEFCMKRDRYRLGIDIPGFLVNIDSIAEKYTDLMPDFIGYTKSQMVKKTPIHDWENGCVHCCRKVFARGKSGPRRAG